MGFKQPRVPEYQSGEAMETYIRTLILFLKDFCQEAWVQSRAQGKAIDSAMKSLNEISGMVMRIDSGEEAQSGEAKPAEEHESVEGI